MEHEWAAVEEEEEEETHFASNGDDDDNDDDDDDNDISCRRATRIIVVVSAQAVELDGNRSSPPSEPVRTLESCAFSVRHGRHRCHLHRR